jgi:hypothetical protein
LEDEKKEDDEDSGEDLIDVNIKEVGLEFEEFSIETDLEQSEVTKFYLKESQKLQSTHGKA